MKFTKSEKIILLQEIKIRPIIWNKKSKGHYNAQRVENAWNDISKILMKSELECKKCFRSLKNCQRYQRNKQRQQLQKRLKETERNEQRIEDNCAGDGIKEWEMDKYLSFLPTKSKINKNKIKKSPSSSSMTTVDNSSQNARPVEILKINEPNMDNDIVEVLNVENNIGIDCYCVTNEDITAASSLLNDACNTSSVDDQYKMQEYLKYDAMLTNIDCLLQKLPETDVIDLNKQFIELIYDKFKPNEDIIKPETNC